MKRSITDLGYRVSHAAIGHAFWDVDGAEIINTIIIAFISHGHRGANAVDVVEQVVDHKVVGTCWQIGCDQSQHKG